MKEDNKLHVEDNEKHLLMDHNYDGIQELNHPLPFWWSFTFYGGIVFAACYIIYYMYMGGPSLRQDFDQDFAIVMSKQQEYKKKEGMFDPELYAKLSTPEHIKKGEEVYINNCLACHQEKGRGDIGPNLTDEYWMWAKGTPETVYPIVFNGVPDNGMPVWSEVLSKEEIYEAVAYVQTLNMTKQPNGKAPQGEKINGN